LENSVNSIHSRKQKAPNKPTLKALQEFVGSKQIVYGTDFPFGAKFASLALKDLKKYDGFSKEDFEAIDYKNCSGLFPQTLAQTQ
jgi:predicted TIM-barrel fold metal-dependent hydrolase